MRRQVAFYRNASGSSPVEEFLDSLPSKAAQKVVWVLSLIEELEIVPAKYFKKLEGHPGVYECRVDFGGNTYRLMGFFHEGRFVVLTNGFQKKSQKTPPEEIDLCVKRMKEFLGRGGKG